METIVCKLEHDGPAVDPASRERLDLRPDFWSEEELESLEKGIDTELLKILYLVVIKFLF